MCHPKRILKIASQYLFQHVGIWVVVKIMIPFGVLKKNTAPSIEGTQNGTMISTTTHMWVLAFH